MSLKSDLQFGEKNECECLPVLTEAFGPVKQSSKYCVYDFFNDRFEIELKSRRVKSSDYDTTLIPYDKVVRDTKKTIILCFKFTDGIYAIEYSKDLFNTFELTKFVRNKRKGYNDRPKYYYKIPVEDLIKL